MTKDYTASDCAKLFSIANKLKLDTDKIAVTPRDLANTWPNISGFFRRFETDKDFPTQIEINTAYATLMIHIRRLMQARGK